MKDESHFWFKDFCLERGINPNLMTKLARENEKFSEAYELVKDMQESRVFKGALMKNFNPTMAKFVLMNCHGWSEKNETRISANSENPITALFESITNTSRDLVQDNEKEMVSIIKKKKSEFNRINLFDLSEQDKPPQ